MAWNQPGGGKTPWGRRPTQGQSDLDEKVKNWQRKLESLWRSGGDGEAVSPLLKLIIIVAFGVWLASGFYQVGAPEKGVIQRFGRLVELHPPGAGWHFPWPIESVTKVNVSSVSRREYKPRVLTADVNLVELDVTVQFRAADPVKYLFQVHEPEATLEQVTESAIREVTGQSTLEDVLGPTRQQLTLRAKALVQRTLDEYNTGLEVTTINLNDVQVPDQVLSSQRDMNKALADKEKAVNEAQAYASGVIPSAQGYAAKAQQDAEAYRARAVAVAEGEAARFSQLAAAYNRAPEVTRERLYLETMENIYARSNKVLVESKSGSGGNVLYLPLEKLLGHAAAAPAAPPAQSEAAPADGSNRAGQGTDTDTVTVEGRSRVER